MILHFSLHLFHFKTLPVQIYPFQPIKFVNLLVLNPCETEPYNKMKLSPNKEVPNIMAFAPNIRKRAHQTKFESNIMKKAPNIMD